MLSRHVCTHVLEQPLDLALLEIGHPLYGHAIHILHVRQHAREQLLSFGREIDQRLSRICFGRERL